MTDCVRIQADCIVASPQHLFAPGQVVCRNGEIVSVSGACAEPPDIRLDATALLPGLVNAHTHLEFSDFAGPLSAGQSFPEWIAAVIAHRGQRVQSGNSQEFGQLAVQKGLAESHAHGVALIADIVTPPWQPQWLNNHNKRPGSAWLDASISTLASTLNDRQRTLLATHLHFSQRSPAVIACMEQLGLTDQRAQASQDWLSRTRQSASDDHPQALLDLAYSPHAPYSLRRDLLASTLLSASQERRVAVMHVAESPAEREWLDCGTGPFRQLYDRLGFHFEATEAVHVDEIISMLATAPHALLIHGNYLTETEIASLAKVRDRVAVVYCPRTHRHFRHKKYPLRALTEAGIRVVFGTDSRSTNPDLNIWREAQTALAEHPWLRATDAFAAITLSAAEALGRSQLYGSIEVGKAAAFAYQSYRPTAGVNTAAVNIEDVLESCLRAEQDPMPLF